MRAATRLLTLLVTALLVLSNSAMATTKSAQNFSNVFHDHYAKSPPLNVAVAANFAKPLKAIASDFTAITGIDVSITTSSSGALYAQVSHGASFDVFLSADTARPAALAMNNVIHSDNVTAYARGRLALIIPFPLSENLTSSNSAVFHDRLSSRLLGSNSLDGPTLESSSAESPSLNNQAPIEITQSVSTQTKMALERFIAETSGKFAIANPKLAPYGLAAHEIINNMSLVGALQGRLVKGKNVLQAYQYVSSGNVKGALVAYSTVLNESDSSAGLLGSSSGKLSDQHYWYAIDEILHRPIVQSLAINDKDAALLHPNIFDAIGAEQALDGELLIRIKPASLFAQFLLSSSVQLSLYNWGYEPALGGHQTINQFSQVQGQRNHGPIYGHNHISIYEHTVHNAFSHIIKTGIHSWDM